MDKGGRSLAGRNTSQYKMFPTTTEAIWFLTRDRSVYVKSLLLQKKKSLGLTVKDINSALGNEYNRGGMGLYTQETTRTVSLLKRCGINYKISFPSLRYHIGKYVLHLISPTE